MAAMMMMMMIAHKLFKLHMRGRSIAQAVSRRLPTAAARVQNRV
jgi:hypothetical protein